MGRMLSRDLRDRVVAAIEDGMSCRAAAARFGVSAASAVRWRQLVIQHGTPAAKPQSGDRRSAPIEDHAALIHAAIEQQSDITLDKLRTVLAGHGVSTSIARECPRSRAGGRFSSSDDDNRSPKITANWVLPPTTRAVVASIHGPRC